MEIENPFKKIAQHPKEVPVALKQKVMNEVISIKLLVDVTELFTSNFKKTLNQLLFSKNKVEKNNMKTKLKKL